MLRILLLLVAAALLAGVVFCIGARAGYGELSVVAFCAFAGVLYLGILFGGRRIAAF